MARDLRGRQRLCRRRHRRHGRPAPQLLRSRCAPARVPWCSSASRCWRGVAGAGRAALRRVGRGCRFGGGLAGWTRWPRPRRSAATLLAGASPAVAIAVVAEGRARGPLAELATEVTVVFEIALILLVAVCQAAAAPRRARAGRAAAGRLPRRSRGRWSGSVAFGALVGAVVHAVSALRRPRDHGGAARALRVPERVQRAARVRAAAGRAGRGPRRPAAYGPGPPRVLHDAIEHGAMPALVLFFAALGASMHVEALATVGLLARGAGGCAAWPSCARASRLGARVAGVEAPPDDRVVAGARADGRRRPRPGGGHRGRSSREWGPSSAGDWSSPSPRSISSWARSSSARRSSQASRDRRRRRAAWSSCRTASRGCTSAQPTDRSARGRRRAASRSRSTR